MKRMILLSIIFIMFLLLNGCIATQNNDIRVSLSTVETKFITNKPITFNIKLNLPYGVKGSAASLIVTSVDSPDNDETTISATRVNSSEYIASYTPNKNGNYKFKAKFMGLGSTKEYESNEIIKYIRVSSEDFPKILNISINNNLNDVKVLNKDENYIFRAVVKPNVSPSLNISLDASAMNGLKIGIGTNQQNIQIVTDMNNIELGTLTTGIYEYLIQLYDSLNNNLAVFNEPQKIQFIVTNDLLSPTFDLDYTITKNKINLETYSNSIPFSVNFIEDKNLDNIGLYKTKISVDGTDVHNGLFQNGQSKDSAVINLSTGLHTVYLYAEDLAGNSDDKTYSVEVKKVDIKATVTPKNNSGDIIQSTDILNNDDFVFFDLNVYAETLESTPATYHYLLKNLTTNRILYDETFSNTLQKSVTTPATQIEEGENTIQLEVTVNGGDLVARSGAFIQVQDVTAPELYKAEMTIDSKVYKIYDKDNPSSIATITNSIIQNKTPSIKVYFRDKSAISYSKDISLYIDGNGTTDNFEQLSVDRNYVTDKSIAYTTTIDVISFGTGQYEFRIPGSSITDANGNIEKDKDGNVVDYSFTLNVVN
ncbi:hypothetical protein OSSY52_09170 [Tepiditoga spiralis]|uniref:Bacterial Ig-like domain-containing protein n=1 Tax=Tepiditoga spiralis TaxID=2108365 RepID=A0A7G1G612_9BACT|nr:hypothetical protein [Tepiditoga spiralis]BBE30776.1 hypothetical protein OSSY52_09170 [Tepiditoga spiralis]